MWISGVKNNVGKREIHSFLNKLWNQGFTLDGKHYKEEEALELLPISHLEDLLSHALRLPTNNPKDSKVRLIREKLEDKRTRVMRNF